MKLMTRRFRSRRVFRAKGKDYVWVTAIGGFSVAENSTTVSLLSAGTWEANSLNFERATLLRVRGYISMIQNAAASAASTPLVALALFKGPLTYSAGDFDPLVSSDYDATDVLWTQGATCGGIPFTSAQLQPSNTIIVDVKAKRKMDSAEQLLFAAAMGSDATASPSVNIQFVLRMLVNRA